MDPALGIRPDQVEQLLAIRSLLNETAFAFEDRDAATQVTAMCELGNCEFSDWLVGARHARHGYDLAVTFDRHMRKLPRAKLALIACAGRCPISSSH